MKIIDVPANVLTLLKQAEHTTTWSVPEPIQHDLVPVKTLEPDMLPESLQPWVVDIAHRMQCPIDFVAAAAVVMLGSVIGTGCSIRPKQNDNWTVVANVWGAAIGRPGRMKSPAISAAMKPLHRLDHIAQKEHQQDMLLHQQAALTKKMKSDLLKAELKTTKSNKETVLAELVNLNATSQEEPVCKRYFTNDCTIESLGEIMKGNPRGVLVNHDELTGLLAGFERAGREGERQGYLTAWNGTDAHRVDRVGRGAIFIERFAASIFGGIQPDKLEHHLAEAQYNHANDGFIQRLQIMVYPDETPVTSVIDVAPDEAAAEKAWKIVSMLAGSIDLAGAIKDEEYEIPYLRLEKKKAQELFYQWLTKLQQKIESEDNTLLQEHLGKYRKLVPSLALIFHLVEVFAETVKRASPVGIQSLEKAIRWADYLESHARRVYAMATDYRVQAAQALAKKIESGCLQDGFTTREIFRNNWSQLGDLEEVKAACDELESANWIRRMPKETGVKSAGRPPLPKYQINPAIGTKKSAVQTPPKPTKRKL